MALHERHAVCVDARGDVYQWGDGFFASKPDAKVPKLTLRGKVGSVPLQVRSTHVQSLYFTEHHKGAADGLSCICALCLRENFCLRSE